MRGGVQFGMGRPGRAVITLIAANVVCFVLQALALRGGAESIVSALYLRPSDVFESGRIWQPFTYMFLHKENAVFHLLMNMLWLYWFGPAMERWWGEKRFMIAYLIFGLSGALLTLLVGLVSVTGALSGLLGGFWVRPHLGASGAVLGVAVAWVLVHWNETLNLLFIGAIKGKTFFWFIVGYELLVLVSFEPTSSSAHFGGMIGAVVLVKGLWRPSKVKELIRVGQLKAKKKKIEHELKVIQGGKNGTPKNGHN